MAAHNRSLTISYIFWFFYKVLVVIRSVNVAIVLSIVPTTALTRKIAVADNTLTKIESATVTPTVPTVRTKLAVFAKIRSIFVEVPRTKIAPLDVLTSGCVAITSLTAKILMTKRIALHWKTRQWWRARLFLDRTCKDLCIFKGKFKSSLLINIRR